MKYDHSNDDILFHPHHVSKKHPPMSLYARSAQFAPFAALTGYEDAVRETARETSERVELDEELKEILDSKLQILQENLKKKSEITITYFIPDSTKEGGVYVTIMGVVKKVDFYYQMLELIDGTEIPTGEIIEISGELFKNFV